MNFFGAARKILSGVTRPGLLQNPPKISKVAKRHQATGPLSVPKCGFKPYEPSLLCFLTEVLYYCHSIKCRAGSTKYISRAIRTAQLCVAHFWLICTILGSLRQLLQYQYSYSYFSQISDFDFSQKLALTPNIYSTGINVILSKSGGPAEGENFLRKTQPTFWPQPSCTVSFFYNLTSVRIGARECTELRFLSKFFFELENFLCSLLSRSLAYTAASDCQRLSLVSFW